MELYAIYNYCQQAINNLNLKYLVYASLAVLLLGVVGQMIRYSVLYRNARLYSKTKSFLKKQKVIELYNFDKYVKKIKGELSRKEREFVRRFVVADNGYCSSFAREKINVKLFDNCRKSKFFRNLSIAYVFVLHALLVCFEVPWVATYLTVFVAVIVLFIACKILDIIQLIWGYFDKKKGYLLDETLCLNLGKRQEGLMYNSKVATFEKGNNDFVFKKSYQESNSFNDLCDSINGFLQQKPDKEIANIIAQNLAEYKNQGILNENEQEKFQKIEESLNNYCL